MEGEPISSSKYNSRSEGSAININTVVGRAVQIISIIWPLNKNRLINVLKNNITIK